MKLALQGEPGSFSHEAARLFLPRIQPLCCATFSQVFDLLVSGKAAAALLPIENSLAGSVTENLDLLLARPVWVQREFQLRISHHLLALPGVRFSQVRRVYSHPVALQQCRDFFRGHRRLEPVPFYDTAGAVKHLAEAGLRDAAAIASRQAAAAYGARRLRSGIEDDKQNFTRFFLVVPGRRSPLPGSDKTSLAFALKNVPGALFKALSVFALREISLSRVESRPVRGKPWEYVFYADILRGSDQAARHALRHLAEIARFVKVLGVYPRAC